MKSREQQVVEALEKTEDVADAIRSGELTLAQVNALNEWCRNRVKAELTEVRRTIAELEAAKAGMPTSKKPRAA